jgi:Rap1a immunity proteins
MNVFRLVPLIVLSLIGSAQAEPRIPDLILGDEWAASCVSKDAAKRTACTQYVLGMRAVFTLWQLMEGQSPIICINLDVNTSQLNVGQKFIRDNPRYRDIPVARVLFDAFHQAWPCERRNP